VNTDLMKLVRSCQTNKKPNSENAIPISIDDSSQTPESGDSDLDLKAILDVLTRQLQQGRVDTKLAALKWIYHLYTIAREKVLCYDFQYFVQILTLYIFDKRFIGEVKIVCRNVLNQISPYHNYDFF
jgi:hypothetical protein